MAQRHDQVDAAGGECGGGHAGRPGRVDAWNTLLRAAATRHGATVVDLNARVCPGGKFTWRAGGVQIRSDGLHFTPTGVRRYIAPWLLPQLAAAAVRPSTS